MSGADDLTPEEKRALEGLASGPEPPPALEEAVVSRLTERGLIATPRPRRRPAGAWALAAAAGVALFAAGLAVGQRQGAPPPAPAAASAPAGSRYVLLLYDAPDEPALSDAEMAARVSEYRQWAIGLRRQGSDITGEKLADGRLDLGAADAVPGPEPLGGYFVFSAKDPEAALAIARSCPAPEAWRPGGASRDRGDVERRRHPKRSQRDYDVILSEAKDPRLDTRGGKSRDRYRRPAVGVAYCRGPAFGGRLGAALLRMTRRDAAVISSACTGCPSA